MDRQQHQRRQHRGRENAGHQQGDRVLQRFRRRAVASLAPTEFRDGGFEVALVEVGPQLVDEDELAVGRLPEQEVAERSEEHTSELQSLMRISYAVFCLKKKNKNNNS